MSFRDHFSETAGSYAEFRPRYPRALFEFLASVVPARRLAWDAATGNGQAALDLADFFDRVIATDASAAQIAEAFAHPRVEYRVAPAEKSGVEPRSMDLVTVAQALHWFDIEAFWKEAARVIVPNGVVAVWCYQLLEVGDAAIDSAVRRFYSRTVGPYWPPERRLVDEGYSRVTFPFVELPAPDFVIEKTITLSALAGNLRTWSATRQYVRKNGADPVTPFLEELRPMWGGEDAKRPVIWPIRLRVGRARG